MKLTKYPLRISQQEIPCFLYRSHRRTVAIHIAEDGCVRIRAPYYVTPQVVSRFIKEKSGWIIRVVQKRKKEWEAISRRRFVDGQTFLFLGKPYPLRVLIDQNRKRLTLHFDSDKWIIKAPSDMPKKEQEKQIGKKLVRWYQEQAKEIFGGRTFQRCRRLGKDIHTISIRGQKSIWGSCHPQKRVIHLNWKLVMAPLDVIDYVITHELCHLKECNHSSRFWRQVAQYHPHYKQSERWLKSHRIEMSLPPVE